MRKRFSAIAACMLCIGIDMLACTNFIITKGASADGSTMVSYSADSHVLYGELYYWPAAKHAEGEMLDIREWDTNRLTGRIPQVPYTYRVVGNTNEHQLTIAETTFGGRHELVNPEGIMDYGSLIYITLQRATNAREAIATMAKLVEEYGYCSSGESFSIADPNEAWIMEMIGKGKDQKGAVWVAVRIPDGYVSGHANQARITTFNLKDKENCLYSSDVISFARKQGYFSGKDKEFSFCDAYAPLDFGAVRFCEARVWSGFRLMNADMMKYEQFAMGRTNERLPLYIKPDHKISKQEVADIMRDHFEGTQMDMSTDIGSGPYHVPYRWRPMEFEVDSVTYIHERAIATQQTGFWFVSQMRGYMPKAFGGILWFGCDDANTSVLVPFYNATTQIPEPFAVGNGNMLEFSWTSAFWIFNWVANMTYARYDHLIVDVRKCQRGLETMLDKAVADMDAKLASLPEAEVSAAANAFSNEMANNVTGTWKKLGEFLMVKYLDGNTHPETNGVFHRTEDNYPVSPEHPKYSDEFYRIIVETTGDKLKATELPK